MTDKTDKGWAKEPDEKTETWVEAFSADAPVVEEEAPVAEAVVVEEPAPVAAAPKDPLSSDEQADADLYDMISEARANVATAPLSVAEQDTSDINDMIATARANALKKRTVGGENKEKTAILEERRKELQKKVASLYTTTGVWDGKPNYECTACPYATLDEELIKQHVTKHI